MTSTITPTPFWLRLLFLLTGQPEKIILDYDQGNNKHDFSNKNKDKWI